MSSLSTINLKILTWKRYFDFLKSKYNHMKNIGLINVAVFVTVLAYLVPNTLKSLPIYYHMHLFLHLEWCLQIFSLKFQLLITLAELILKHSLFKTCYQESAFTRKKYNIFQNLPILIDYSWTSCLDSYPSRPQSMITYDLCTKYKKKKKLKWV